MIATLINRWRPRLQAAAPWARWTTVALASAAVLAVAPSALWIRCSMAPALAISLIQLGRLTRAAMRQPQLDREADDRLQVLVDRTCLPDVHLVEVAATEQVSAAGQLANTIDLATGQGARLWFTQACFPPGSLVLVDDNHDTLRALDWMLPIEVQAAYRHRRRAARSRAKDEVTWQRELTRDLRNSRVGSEAHPTGGPVHEAPAA